MWTMAATFYHMLTGQFQRDFVRGKDPWQTVLQTDPLPIRKRDASIPRKLADVLDLALADKKGLHFKTAAEFKQALIEVLS